MTITGIQALHEIDGAIRTSRDASAIATKEAAESGERLINVKRAEARAYGSMADIRLQSLGQHERGVDALQRIDERAQVLLTQHGAHIAQLQHALNKSKSKLEALERSRLEQETILNEAIDDHEHASEATRKRLNSDPDYQTRADALEKANAIVDHAASKQKVAANDRAQKGKPYEDDPLFAYLWQRQYATKDYRAFGLFAIGDRWVAGLIRYRDARLNYERLLDLPERLGEHLSFVNEKATLLADDIEAYERSALTADGVDDLRDGVEAERTKLEALDQEIVQAETVHQQAIAALNAANDGTHGPLADARALLTNALQDKSIPDLKLLAAETLTPDDDALVEQLAQLRLDRYAIEDNQKAAARSRDSWQRGLSDLENLRRRFKQMRFDSHQSEFHSAEMISLLLSDFARGTLGASEVWRQLEKSHRVRRRDWQDDFGGDDWRGGFGLPGPTTQGRSRSGTNWSRVGRDITREIERELGRELGRTLGGGSGPNWGGLSGTRRQTRRRPRSVTLPGQGAPRIRVPRTPRTPTRSGGGGFKTGGGF